MTFPTVAVGANLSDITGQPCARVDVTVQLDKPEVWSGGNIPAIPITVTADAQGNLVFSLFPNNPQTGLGRTGSTYTFFATLPNGQVWSAQAQVPNVPCNLQDITLTAPLPAPPPLTVRADIVQGFTDAQRAQARANIGADQGVLTSLASAGGASLVGLSLGLAHEQPMTVQDYTRGQVINGMKFLTPAERASVLARDGLVDVTASVAYAVAQCAGNTLYWEPGRYVVSSVPVLLGLRIVGVPGATVFERAQGTPLLTDLFYTDSNHAPERRTQNLEIYGIVFDGGNLTPQRWLQHADGTPVTDPQADYYDAITNPTGKIGNPAFPGYTIFDVVAAGRRNPLYTQCAALLKLNLVDGADIRMCLFRNHKGRGIFEAGGRNVVIEQNGFDGICKNDGPFHAVYTQSYGTPGGGQSFYSPSENIQIRKNWARNLERSFIAFLPTKGGACEDNYCDGWQESCIFTSEVMNRDGGRSSIQRNTFKNGIISDIVCYGIEGGSISNCTIKDNWIENAAQGGISLPGATNVKACDNTTKNIGVVQSYPYGPFSERYAYNVGSSPVAGLAIPIEKNHHIEVGSQGVLPGGGILIRDHVWIETRDFGATYPFCVAQAKSGQNNIAGDVTIQGGAVRCPTAMQFLDKTVTGVWLPTIPFTIRDVVGHVSVAPVPLIRFILAGSTGVKTFDVGFRPRLVRAYVTKNGDPAAGRLSFGEMAWNAAASANAFAYLHSADIAPAAQYDAVDVNALLSVFDTAGNRIFRGNFFAWTETGFQVLVTIANIDTQIEFVCWP